MLPVQRFHLQGNVPLPEVGGADAPGQRGVHIEQGGHLGRHGNHQRGIVPHLILNGRQVGIQPLQDGGLCRGVTVDSPASGGSQSGQGAVTVGVDLRHHLGALELAHHAGGRQHEVGVVDLLLIEGELAAPVHGHLLGLPGEVHAALHEAGLPVIVGQTIHVQHRDFDLGAAVVPHQLVVQFHPAAGSLFLCRLIQFSLEDSGILQIVRHFSSNLL